MSATTASSTRSSSPATSESLSDEQNAFQPVDFSVWCHPFSPGSDAASWDMHEQSAAPKLEDNSLLMLGDFVHDRSYEPITPESPVSINPAVFQLSQSRPEAGAALNLNMFSNFSSDNSSSESAPVSDLIPRTTATAAMATKVVPPPPAQPRKTDSSASHRVIFPAKESCYNLALLTPNIPSTGTKSRVETQVRVALDLALASGSSGDPLSYDRIGSWKWLKLPKGTATRKRSRKEGKIDDSPMDTLYLEVEVTCATNPSKHVSSCQTCQGREAKRVARKIAARVRPARSDSDSNDGPSGEGDASSNIIQFNCPDTLDFSSGSVVLPLRITCYCRHHREKVGFNVHFTVTDDSGRVVGKGMSPPIMITDDHKSVDKSSPKNAQVVPFIAADADWEPRAPVMPSTVVEPVVAEPSLTSRRRQSGAKEGSGTLKRRSKPYDTGRPAGTRSRRGEPSEGNVYPSVTQAAPAVSNPYPDATTLAQYRSAPSSVHSSTAPPSPSPPDRDMPTLPSPAQSYGSPTSPQSSYFENSDQIMHEALMQPSPFFPISPPNTAPSSPPMGDLLPQSLNTSPLDLSSFTYSLLQPQPELSISTLPAPKIHRLVPSSGPTFGGIEVTILGSNFHSSVRYNCVFGDVVASSTSHWSENTLVCILPPRACAGVVPVTLQGLKLDNDPLQPVLFTYTDETDRNLMELALQVVGLKMTGKIEDAKDIAMRIVGTSSSGQTSQTNNMDVTQMVNLASGSLPDSRGMLLGRTDDVEFEKIIMDSLSALDLRDDSESPPSLTHVVSHQTKTGQTLLHLACFLNFPSLAEFLIQREIDMDAQDINGCTALHFAALSGSSCCARLTINAGADINIVDKFGRTPVELGSPDFLRPLLTRTLSSTGSRGSSSGESDDESNFGDVEEDSGDEGRAVSRPLSRSHSRRKFRHSRSRRSSKPASVVADASDVEEPFDYDAAADDDDNATVVSPEPLPMPDSPGKDGSIDEKQAASFAEYLQRAWAQIQPPHLMPQMPQLPGVPAWVFPVFIPMQAWPPFRTEKRDEALVGHNKVTDAAEAPTVSNEWRASWEKWMTQMTAAMARQNQLAGSGPGPVDQSYKAEAMSEQKFDNARIPLASDGIVAEATVAQTPMASRSILRRFRYGSASGRVSEKEIKAYTYRPKMKSAVKNAKKEDRMLVIFWIPILLLAIGWAIYSAFPTVMSLLERHLPFEESANISV